MRYTLADILDMDRRQNPMILLQMDRSHSLARSPHTHTGSTCFPGTQSDPCLRTAQVVHDRSGAYTSS